MTDLRTPSLDDEERRRATIDKIIDATNATLRDRVIAIYTYGSDFGRPRPHPPLRILILVDQVDRHLLDDLAPIVARARSTGMTIKIESHETLLRGTDAFPLFALELADTATLIDGDDVLADINVDPVHLRLRLEQTLRTIHRDLVADYLQNVGDPQGLATALRRSAHQLPYLFEAILIACRITFSGHETPTTIIKILCREVAPPSDAPTWERLRSFATYETMLDPAAVRDLYADILPALNRLIAVIDRIDEESVSSS